MNRRTFLKIAGVGSIAVAAGCTAEPEKTLYSLVQAPDDMVREGPLGMPPPAGNALQDAASWPRTCEGRVIKLEGNPRHPINRGSLCMRGQAALQGVYASRPAQNAFDSGKRRLAIHQL